VNVHQLRTSVTPSSAGMVRKAKAADAEVSCPLYPMQQPTVIPGPVAFLLGVSFAQNLGKSQSPRQAAGAQPVACAPLYSVR
jgi:hypothetical protein